MDRLQREYGADLKLVHYIAATLPHHQPTIVELSISQLRQQDTVQTITASSTFYVPPATAKAPSVEVAKSLNLSIDGNQVGGVPRSYFPHPRWGPLSYQGGNAAKNSVAYGDTEKAAVAAMDSLVPPAQYAPLRASRPMTDLMTKLALDDSALSSYNEHPRSYIQSQQSLSPVERAALESGSKFNIYNAMKAYPDDVTESAMADETVVVVVIVVI